MQHKFKAAFVADVIIDWKMRYFRIRYCTKCRMAAPYDFTFEPIEENIIDKKDIKGWSHDYAGCRERKDEKNTD